MKRILNIFGIEWCLLLVALLYIDPSVAMLGAMFVGPIVVLLFFIINFVIKKFENYIILQKVFVVLRIISILATIALSISVIMYGIKLNSPDERFRSLIANPIPESVENIEQGGTLAAMGSSSFFMTFNISPADFKTIISSERFSKFHQIDINNVAGRQPEMYKEILGEARNRMSDVSEMYIDELTNSVYRFDALIVNKEHTRVYYGSK